MEKYYFEKELKEAVLIKNGDRTITMVLNGEGMEVCCPELCSMNIREDGSPCLVSEDKIPNDRKYEVVAFSLDNLNRENKDWICLEPAIFEDAFEFFLACHCMEGMVNGCTFQKIESRGDAGPDFMAGDACIQINIPDAILNPVDGEWFEIKSLLLTGRKIARHRNLIANFHGTGKRIIFLTIFQHNLNDNLQGLLCKELSRFFGMDMEEGNEFWVADAKLEPDGITLLSYQSITDRVLLS